MAIKCHLLGEEEEILSHKSQHMYACYLIELVGNSLDSNSLSSKIIEKSLIREGETLGSNVRLRLN